MLEEFDPMCDDGAFEEKQKKINGALYLIKREEELRIRDEERRHTMEQFVPQEPPQRERQYPETWVPIGQVQGPITTTTFTYGGWTYGNGAGGTTTNYFPAQIQTYTTAGTATVTLPQIQIGYYQEGL
jgi:hypothetical protein